MHTCELELDRSRAHGTRIARTSCRSESSKKIAVADRKLQLTVTALILLQFILVTKLVRHKNNLSY